MGDISKATHSSLSKNIQKNKVCNGKFYKNAFKKAVNVGLTKIHSMYILYRYVCLKFKKAAVIRISAL
jgi:hypothetical protein